MILLIDNYDSFSYNLYQLIGTVERDIKVVRNDECSLKDIEDIADWLILIMPVLFVPSAVSLMNVGDELLGDIVVIGVVLVVSTIVVMVTTGKVAQLIIERKENKNG